MIEITTDIALSIFIIIFISFFRIYLNKYKFFKTILPLLPFALSFFLNIFFFFLKEYTFFLYLQKSLFIGGQAIILYDVLIKKIVNFKK